MTDLRIAEEIDPERKQKPTSFKELRKKEIEKKFLRNQLRVLFPPSREEEHNES